MSVITFASSKGGAGKTTSAIILSSILSKGARVAMIDADPTARLAAWADKADLPDNIAVQASEGELAISREINAAKRVADFVVVDLPGGSDQIIPYAMGKSDLVIVPMGDSQMEAEGAIETIASLRAAAEFLDREIPFRILFTRTQAAVKSRNAKSLNAQVRDKLGGFTTELHHRTAFQSVTSFGGALQDLDPNVVGGLQKAIQNAELFAEEVLHALEWVSQIREKGA